MKVTDEEVTIILPRHVEDSVSVWRQLALLLAANNDNHTNCKRNGGSCYSNELAAVVVLKCHVQRPGVVWRALEPCLFQAPPNIAKRAVKCIKQELGLSSKMRVRSSNSYAANIDDIFSTSSSTSNITRRTLRLARRKRRNNLRLSFTTKIRHRWILWIQPPITTHFHTQFSSALVRFEHNMILYQSLAAWFSTLGGGYFFCRHLSTALALAKQQQRVALLMGDYTMAYKCVVNQAYDYIYAGKFSMATKTLNGILSRANKPDLHPPIDPVVISMCRSAKLFCRRFKQAAKTLNTIDGTTSSSPTRQAPNGWVPPRTVDDFQRIRIVQDQSTPADHL